MKKLLSTLAVSAILVGSTNANPFADVPAGHWAYTAVNHVVTSGVMKGYRGGMFKGQETVNRYEMAVIISRILAKMEGKTVSTDVRRTMDRLGEEFMDELDLIGARLTALENAFHEHVTEVNNMKLDSGSRDGFKISGSLAHRTEFWSADRHALEANNSDSMDRTFAQGRINIEKNLEKADVFAQLQQTYQFGNRAGATNGVDPSTTELHQLYGKFYFGDDRDDSLKIGRQTVSFGDEAFIGADEWSLQGRTFDGFIYEKAEKDDFNWNVFWFKVNNDVSALNAAFTADQEQDVFGFNLDFKKVGDGDLSLFYYQSNDNDFVPFPGSIQTAMGLVALANYDTSLDLFGLNYKLDKDEWHYWLQYAKQGGELERAGVAANVMEFDGDMLNVRVGYDFDDDKQVALEYTNYSGDNGAAGTTYNGFMPMFGTEHKFLGNADIFAQNNIEDWTVHFKWNDKARSEWGLAYHMFKLDEELDGVSFGTGMPLGYYYNGAGAFAGLPMANAGGISEDDLGNEIDLTYKYKYSKDVDFKFGYSMFNAGDFFTRNARVGAPAGTLGHAPDVDFAYFTTAVKF